MIKMKDKKTTRFNIKDGRKILQVNSPFAVKEAYSAARANIMFTKNGDKCPVYILTSALPQEGKSINCVNIAISFALAAKRVLIIDMDMRNPTIHKLFKIRQENGVSEFLAGIDQIEKYKATRLQNLMVLTCGKTPPNPAELLSSERVADLLSRAKQKFDYIFVDMPPIEVVADVSIVAKHMTGLILIVKSGCLNVSVLKHSVDVLRQVDTNIVGFLLNNVNPKTQSYGRTMLHYKYYKNYFKYGYAVSENDR